MSTGETTSKQSSDRTSRSAPPSSGKGREADLLAHEAAAAKAALLETLQEIKSELATAADPRLWAQQHPWAAIGAAVAAGFAAATLVVPSPRQDLKQRFSDLLAAESSAPSSDVNGEATAPARVQGGLLATLMVSLLDVAKTAVTNFVMAAVHKSADDPGLNVAVERKGPGAEQVADEASAN